MKLQLYCHACYAMAIVSESEHQFSHSALTRCPSGTTSMSPWAGHSDACTDASRKPQREQRDGQWFGIGLGSCLLHVCIVLHICCNCALYNLNIFEPQISIYIYYMKRFFFDPQLEGLLIKSLPSTWVEFIVFATRLSVFLAVWATELQWGIYRWHSPSSQENFDIKTTSHSPSSHSPPGRLGDVFQAKRVQILSLA